ncbi:hypothetical protein ACWCV3_28970, partial [Streptomyces sp. NPDC001781]
DVCGGGLQPGDEDAVAARVADQDHRDTADVGVRLVGAAMGLDEDAALSHVRPVSFHASRPGHDLRYALDGDKLARFGWTQPVSLEKSIETTVRWTLDHPEWLAL